MAKSKLDVNEASKREQWLAYGNRLIPLIADYTLKHPEAVTFPQNDDRARIAGLGDFLNHQQTGVAIRGDEILNPWGDPIWIVIEHTHPIAAMVKRHSLRRL